MSIENDSDVVHVIGIGQLRGDTCRYIDRVTNGENFDIVWHGRVVARLSAFKPPHGQFTIAVPLNVLRTSASRLLARVTASETITIQHRGEMVATLRAHSWDRPGRPCRLNPAIRSTTVL